MQILNYLFTSQKTAAMTIWEVIWKEMMMMKGKDFIYILALILNTLIAECKHIRFQPLANSNAAVNI